MVSAELLLTDYQNGCALPRPSGREVFPPADGFLSSRLPTAALALGSVGALASAVDRLLASRGLDPHPWALDPERVAASFAGDAMMRIDGEPVSGFAPMSGFFAAADGWVRTHANYPHHRARLLEALELAEDSDAGVLSSRIGTMSAQEVEDRAAESGAVAARVRTEAQWSRHPQGVASAVGPIVRMGTPGSAPGTDPTPLGHAGRTTDPARPLAGLRVLDLTRVLAGPVAGRALALLGAQVLRVDPPHLHEIDWQHRDTGQGKRSALLDLGSDDGARAMRGLLSTADVLVTGYRPGALDRFGLAEAAAGMVHGSVSAWGTDGPWAHRRGFDSIVQAATGISLAEGGEHPGVLPVQALDHASGYLLAAGIVDALTLRRGDGSGRTVSVSLARTARWLLDAPGRVADPVTARAPGPDTTVTHGAVTAARPPLPGCQSYPFPAHDWGADAPHWV
ncbi:CoA transferase [Rhodococcus tukisamuensis]|uniref:CoA-transferase family III n=1 Tax=Rhodococcus tukisamuensis TaxID=168276 RepID=A0A1G6U336_9NOCA|nr:CoA transferase [Rhodococcus tukisamuensis]SDD35096.1 CoA-transferase family III [Rhodococcus tukisamuensis]